MRDNKSTELAEMIRHRNRPSTKIEDELIIYTTLHKSPEDSEGSFTQWDFGSVRSMTHASTLSSVDYPAHPLPPKKSSTWEKDHLVLYPHHESE
eukprot:UN30312